MKNRSKITPTKVYLTKEEHEKLKKLSKASGYSESGYMRSLLQLVVPKPKPDIEYFQMIRHLSAIGNNLNQIAKAANSFGDISYEYYESCYIELKNVIQEIREAVQLPEAL